MLNHMSIFVDARDLPLTIELVDASMEEALHIVERWVTNGETHQFVVNDTAAVVVPFGRIGALQAGTERPSDHGALIARLPRRSWAT